MSTPHSPAKKSGLLKRFLVPLSIFFAFLFGLMLSTCGESSNEVSTSEVTVTETVTPAAVTETVTETVTQTPAAVTETVEAEPEIRTETVTETVTVEAAPEPASEDSFSDEEINDIAIQFAWDNLSYDEQEQACLGIMLDEDMMIDAFMEGAGGSFDEQQVREFFREVCGI